MDDQTDQHLLREYAGQRSEAAFAELVRRHVDLVYSAALRMVRDSHLAQDVTQSVFVALAQSARQLTDRPVLAGWLHVTARNLAANAIRSDVRRRVREQEAAAMNELTAAAAPDVSWEQIAPQLDVALGELSEPDRDALLLRYFERKTAQEMAQILGISDVAAQKRVNRAVERLRENFAKRKVAIGAGGLAVLISANAVQAAPAGLAATVSTSAFLAGAAVQTSAVIAATKIIAMSTMQKAAFTVALAVAVGAGIYEANQAGQLRGQVSALKQQQVVLSDQLRQLQEERDAATKRVAALGNELARSQSNNLEVLKLRKEVTQLQNEAGDPMVSAAEAWAKKVDRLKQKLAATPNAAIPEMQFLDEEDWLAAVKNKHLDTDDDFRRAFSQLRHDAENNFAANYLKPALTRYSKANDGKFPTDLSQLQPYFKSPVDDAVLDRWQIAQPSVVPNLGMGNMIITEKAAVDDVLDQRMAIGLNGYGTTDWLSSESGVLKPVYKAFESEGGNYSNFELSDLMPYATTPEQKVALQKRIEQQALRK